jgi:DNA-directed RNA polymerase specialized sigma24 family protein
MQHKNTDMATALELDQFLARVERKAFKQTVYAVREEQTALDLVQDAMLRLSQKYGDRPVEELAPLFTRILQNATLDFFRREKIRKLWMSPLSIFSNDQFDNNDTDPLELIEPQAGTLAAESTADTFEPNCYKLLINLYKNCLSVNVKHLFYVIGKSLMWQKQLKSWAVLKAVLRPIVLVQTMLWLNC